MKRSFTVRQGALDGVEAFLGVTRHHSFRKAADELGVTTSAVSQAIRALEARVCLALFIRTTRTAKMRWATYWRLRAVDAALDEQRLFTLQPPHHRKTPAARRGAETESVLEVEGK